LSHDEDFAQSALSVAIKFDDLLERIVRLGLNYQVAWRTTDV